MLNEIAGLGYSDLSCMGSEVRTTNIDSLATEGTRFTDFHATAAHSPSHASLLTGCDHHVTGLGQTVETLMDSPSHRGKPGHEGFLTEQVASLPEALRRDGGYFTAMAGKWNLGLEPEHFPDKRGFDRSFSLLGPAAMHFRWDAGAKDEEKLPRFAQTNVTPLYAENGQYVDLALDLPPELYSSDYFADKLLDYLEHRPTDKPFFAHLSFSAPHWPLQAPANEIRQYFGCYDEGPKTLRERRLEGLKKLKLVPQDMRWHPMVASDIPKWGSLSPEQRAKSARTMETYAAMVTRMDYNVGRLLSWLKYRKQYHNTQIIFLSTNGPAGASPNLDPKTGAAVQRYIDKYHQNDLAYIGDHASYTWYGARWAQASSPFRLYGGFPTEGGTRVPCVVKPANNVPFVKPLCHALTTIQEIAPTIAEQAGIAFHEGATKSSPFVQGQFSPHLRGRTALRDYTSPAFGSELYGRASLRKGNWKISFFDRPLGSEEWELFDLKSDPGETNDLARKRPDKLEELVKEFMKYRQDVGVVGLGPQLRSGRGGQEMTDPSTWVKFETSRAVAQREHAKRWRKMENASRDKGDAEADETSEDEFQDLDDDAVEMV